LLQLGSEILDVGPSIDLASAGEIVSLLLIFATFCILAYTAYRSRSTRSFQFEMFIFILILAFAEIPRIFETILGWQMESADFYGLVIHTVSMFVLAFFVISRAYKFMKK